MSAPSDTGMMPLRPALRPEEAPMSPKSGPAKGKAIVCLEGCPSCPAHPSFYGMQLSTRPHANLGQSFQSQSQKKIHSLPPKTLQEPNNSLRVPRANG
jgi:hypothetical protein